MTRQLKLFWLGMLVYVVSFFLPAVAWPGSSPPPIVGFVAAFISLSHPLEEAIQFFQGVPPLFAPLEDAALLISGCINPFFLLTAFLILIDGRGRALSICKILLLLMIPFCWLFFTLRHFYPREGHFLWVLGMLLVLFSGELASIRNS
jgi:hypothetical protein